MSAFLYFSQDKRRQIKESNPSIRNTEVSRILGEMWRNAAEEERRPHIEKEKEEREKYKIAIAKWREEYEKKMEEQRKQQAEQVAYMNNVYQGDQVPQPGQPTEQERGQYPPPPPPGAYGEPPQHGGYGYMPPGGGPPVSYGYGAAPPRYPMYCEFLLIPRCALSLLSSSRLHSASYSQSPGQYGYANGKHVTLLGPSGMPMYPPSNYPNHSAPQGHPPPPPPANAPPMPYDDTQHMHPHPPPPPPHHHYDHHLHGEEHAPHPPA